MGRFVAVNSCSPRIVARGQMARARNRALNLSRGFGEKSWTSSLRWPTFLIPAITSPHLTHDFSLLPDIMDAINDLPSKLAQLARLALSGQQKDIALYLARLVRLYRGSIPELSQNIQTLLDSTPTRNSPLRREVSAPVPVDIDSRLQLLRIEEHPFLESEPIFRDSVHTSLQAIIDERQHSQRLLQAGLTPTKTVLFTGPPGVGKTLSARWLASKIGLPLFTLDLSAVMSSFLGRTGGNVRHVLDYAKSQSCILFLDEFDAVAKRRDDSGEIGELKRLVTVLLQEIDSWPASGLLIAATNHPDLLDPAVWRRFEVKVDFPLPSPQEAQRAIKTWLGEDLRQEALTQLLAICFGGHAFSEIERVVLLARRSALLREVPVEDQLLEQIRTHIGLLPRAKRLELALLLHNAAWGSQREIQQLTSVSRDTIRKALTQPVKTTKSTKER